MGTRGSPPPRAPADPPPPGPCPRPPPTRPAVPRPRGRRKHYFYPDQPHGYQITQRAEPIVLGGAVDIDTPGRGPRRVAIARVQLETDTAQTTGGGALLDFNRAGTGLLEVVTEPDMRSADEAVALVGEVQSILRAAGVSGCQMEHGQFRVDVNVSCRGRRGGGATGRSELKNMISLKFIRRAIEAEARRHQDALRRGEALAPETRGYDAASGRSYPLRSKEDAPDYRYMPEPDLPGVVLTDGEIAALARELPELPQRARQRLQAAGVPGDTAGVLSRRPELLALVDGVKAAGGEAVGGLADVARFVAHEAVAAAARAGGGAGGAGGAGDSARLGRLDAAAVAEVLAAERAGRLNRRLARDVLARVAAGDGAPVSELVAAAGGGAAAGPGAGPDASLEELCRGVLARDDMARAVANWRAGVKRSNMLRAFLGQLMKETGGRADARRATAVIEGLLRGEGGGGGGSD